MKKVAIIGRAPSWQFAPFKDTSIEIWAMNDMYDMLPRFDRWFDMHDMENISQHVPRDFGGSHLERLQGLQIPIYMQEAFPEIPTAVKYPKRVLATFKRCFTSTGAYMIALAIDEGYDVIYLYGIDAIACAEYAHQLPALAYWVGVADGLGIKLIIAPQANLLNYPLLYGYDETNYGTNLQCPANQAKIPITINVLYESIISKNGIYEMLVPEGKEVELYMQLVNMIKTGNQPTQQMLKVFATKLEQAIDAGIKITRVSFDPKEVTQ